MDNLIYPIILGLCALFVLVYIAKHHRHARGVATQHRAMVMRGGEEPVSLHPALDPGRCISIGACATACPEGDIIGMVNGRPELIEPSRCIGHGACAAACPVDAITLVFGTATRGLEIPHVKPTFETNVQGIFIAGELGGMGLIRNAVTQGRQAMDSIARNRATGSQVLDALVVGAGPAGISATLQARHAGLRTITIDQDDVGGTVRSYPRQKLVMTQPMEIPLYGKFTKREVSKEELIDLWDGIIRSKRIEIQTQERLEALTRNNGHFEITTSRGKYAAANVLLAIGRRGTPRKLGVAGEDLAKVTYRLLEPEQYAGRHCLVVGGGDSAVEAAVALSQQPGTHVTLSYRGKAFARIKEDNRMRIEAAAKGRSLRIRMESTVCEIGDDAVTLEDQGRTESIDNDFVFVFAGGVLPTAMLKSVGVHVEMKFGEK